MLDESYCDTWKTFTKQINSNTCYDSEQLGMQQFDQLHLVQQVFRGHQYLLETDFQCSYPHKM